MIIDERGVVIQTDVLKSTHPEFGRALAAALQAYSFEPALKQGKPIVSALKMEQEFDPADADRDERALLAEETRHPEEILAPKSAADIPKAIARPAPAYPPEKTGTSGRAVVEFLIDRDGHARLPRIVSATDPAFGYAGVQAISRWQFEKPVIQGRAAVLRVRMPLEFNPPAK
jgi:TonB family protein